jgi:glycosyltransferase involved in cell wall biosynthesis
VGFDWVWISYPPIVADVDVVTEFRRRSTRVSWDWDCLSLLNARAARHSGRTARAAAFALRSLTCLHYERYRLARLDLLSVPGPVDAAHLRRTTGREVQVLRAAVDCAHFRPALIRDAKQPVALFIGSRWGPNVHGIRWVLREVWPDVSRRMPTARLRIVGRGMTAEVIGDVPAGVEVVGDVPDVTLELAQARAVLCPIFYGAGIPTKLLEAGASGKATLTTTYCERALGGSGFRSADDPQSWREDLLRVLGDAHLAREWGTRGHAVIARDWSVEAWENDMAQVERAIGSYARRSYT